MDCVKNIGCFPSCNAIKFPYPALETGVHFVVFDWLGTKKTIAFEAVEGETFYIPNYFNESSDPVFSIKQPSGDYLCWDKEAEALAVCPDDCGKDCDFYRHFTLEINQTSDFPGQDNEDPDLAYSDKVYNIDEAHDNGDGTYTINVIGAANGDLAVDDNGTFYEYNNGVWTIKFKEVCAFQDVDTLPVEGEDCALYFQGGKYWAWDGAQYVDVTPTIDFDDIDNLPNLVQSVNNGTGIDVDNTDPENPIVGLNQASQDSLDLADSAVQSVTGDGVDNTDPQNPVVNIPDQVCSVQSYPTFAEFPDEPESCVLYIDESTKKQYIESGGAYLEVGSSENIYNTNGVLTGNRIVNLDGKGLTFSGNQAGGEAFLRINSFGDGTFTVNTAGTPLIGVAFRALFARELILYTGQDLTILTPTTDYYALKLVSTSGKVEYHPITADDIDDSTSVQKFVTQAEKDQIGKPIPEYASDTAADNDSNLPSGAMYAVTGDRTVKRKP